MHPNLLQGPTRRLNSLPGSGLHFPHWETEAKRCEHGDSNTQAPRDIEWETQAAQLPPCLNSLWVRVSHVGADTLRVGSNVGAVLNQPFGPLHAQNGHSEPLNLTGQTGESNQTVR